jgi:hypothetical protein
MTNQDMTLTLVSCAFFMALVAFISYRQSKDESNSRDGYFLAGRGLSAVFIAGSLLLTNLSAEQLIGLQLNSLSSSVGGRLQFAGLDSNSLYMVNIVWPAEPKSYSKSILDVINGSTMSGDALKNTGVQLPIIQPASMLVFHLYRTS